MFGRMSSSRTAGCLKQCEPGCSLDLPWICPGSALRRLQPLLIGWLPAKHCALHSSLPRSCATTRVWRWPAPSTCAAMRHLGRRPPTARTRSECAALLAGGWLAGQWVWVSRRGGCSARWDGFVQALCAMPCSSSFKLIPSMLPVCCSLGRVANEAFCDAVSKWTFQVR